MTGWQVPARPAGGRRARARIGGLPAPARALPPCGALAGRDMRSLQQALRGQPVVALGIIRAHAALVGEPDVDRVPVDACPARGARRSVRGGASLSARWACPRSSYALRSESAICDAARSATTAGSAHVVRRVTPPWRAQRPAPARRSGRAAAPGGCPRRAPRSLLGRRRGSSTGVRRRRLARDRAQAARAAVQAQAPPEAVWIVTPSRPRTCSSGARRRHRRTSLVSSRAMPLNECFPRRAHPSASPGARPATRRQHRADLGRGVMADLHGRDRPQIGATCRGIEAGGSPLAPGVERSQARSTTYAWSFSDHAR